MPNTSTASSGRHPVWQMLGDMVAVLRLLRGPILASLAATAILYLPDQIRELYRIAAADRAWNDAALGIGSLIVMSGCFWWVSFRIVRSLGQAGSEATAPAGVLRSVLPGLIGALPLAGCGAGLLSSMPARRAIDPDMTSPWAGKAEEIVGQMGTWLVVGGAGLLGLALVAFAGAVLLDRRLGARAAASVREKESGGGFFSVIGLFVSLAIVIGATALVIEVPVVVPAMVGTIPLVAVFFIAIILMVGQMTFWNEATRMPFFMLLGIAALTFSALDLNDNHEIATVADPAKAASPELRQQRAGDSWDSFKAWYEARPNRDKFKSVYPVYVVAAQGGGIYAAYHTATLLARLQDRCPEFRNHLFAISSVSGGSLGAAVFSSAVKALASPKPGVPATTVAASPAGEAAFLPCPSMERAGLNRQTTYIAGPHEQAVANVLSFDFLSPLVAGTLFPDYTQRFLPFPVPGFDRARWLERAFAEGWTKSGLAGPNPFEESLHKAWAPAGPSPALLINTTESDSGRRLVISPFSVSDGNEVLSFPLWDYWSDKPRRFCKGHDISLATAVSLSARFPWLTPAGTLTSNCPEPGKPERRRLVDGGYFDNSGVDTALDVIDRIESTLRHTNGRAGGPDGPRIELHLIVLNTSDFPERGGYGFGDALEPIRALLSTRSARTPISINRGVERMGQPAPGRGDEHAILDRLHQVRFHNPIYEMPLGWRISKGSRDIIDIQNGRFWDCNPDTQLRQKGSEDFSAADCLQLLVFHQLSETLSDEMKVLAQAETWRNRRPPVRTPNARFPHDRFFACYNDLLREATRTVARVEPDKKAVEARPGRGLQRRQRDAIDQILRLWDANPQFVSDDWLAFMLAYVERETGSIAFREGGCLTEKCAVRYLGGLAKRSSTMSYYYNELMTPDANGNRYYARGFLQLATKLNYSRVASITGEPVLDQPDLLLAPDVSARVLFAWMTEPRLTALARFTTKDGFDLAAAVRTYIGPASLNYERALVQLKPIHRRYLTCIAKAKAER